VQDSTGLLALLGPTRELPDARRQEGSRARWDDREDGKGLDSLVPVRLSIENKIAEGLVHAVGEAGRQISSV